MAEPERHRSTSFQRQLELYEIRQGIEVYGLRPARAFRRAIRLCSLPSTKKQERRLKIAYYRAKKSGTLPEHPPFDEAPAIGISAILASDRATLAAAEEALPRLTEALQKMGLDPESADLEDLYSQARDEARKKAEYLHTRFEHLVVDFREEGLRTDAEMQARVRELQTELVEVKARLDVLEDYLRARNTAADMRQKLYPIQIQE